MQTRSKILLPLLMPIASLIAASAVHADPVGYYGNTLLIKRDYGTGKLVYRPDHTFTMIPIATAVIKAEPLNGAWLVKDGMLCLTPEPGAKLMPFCVPDDPVHVVGDTWPTKAPTGETEMLTLVKGQ